MERNFTHYYFLISCPDDVQDDIKAVLQAFDSVNRNIGELHHIHLVTLFWKNDAIPAAGNSAQAIVNQQLLNKADGVIALFWTRFGTPTDKYGSGTEEEIERAIADNKDVLLFCSERRIVPNKLIPEQHVKVENFKNRFHGLFASYKSKTELKTRLTHALASLIIKYVHDQRSSVNPLSNGPNDSISYSLAEYFDLGWYIARSKLEVPGKNDSSSSQKITLTARLSLLLEIETMFCYFTPEERQSIISYRNEMAKLGLEQYFNFHTPDEYEKIHELLQSYAYELQKKLQGLEFSVFQLGMHMGYYAMLFEVEFFSSSERYSLTLSNISDTCSEIQDEYSKIIKFARCINPIIHQRLDEITPEKNLDLPVSIYINKLHNLTEEIMIELNL